MIYLGIDPGKSGALAILSSTGEAQVFDTPVISDGSRRQYDLDALSRLLTSPTPDLPIKAAIEEIGPIPKQGVVASFYMGYGLGLWHVALSMSSIPFIRVRPQVWKKEFGLIGKNKDASRLRAIELFPQLKDQLKRKKDDGRAEALLIAEWMRRQA